MHHYYHRDGVTDLSKMREDALARLNSKGMFRGSEPEESTIHLHPGRVAPEPGETQGHKLFPCEGQDHEGYFTEGVKKWRATSSSQ